MTKYRIKVQKDKYNNVLFYQVEYKAPLLGSWNSLAGCFEKLEEAKEKIDWCIKMDKSQEEYVKNKNKYVEYIKYP